MQRIVEACDRARGIAEGGMRRDVLDPLAIDIDLAPVAQALEIFRAGERPSLGRDRVFGFHSAASYFFLPTLSLLAYLPAGGHAILAGA
jgi:hypothetical protein